MLVKSIITNISYIKQCMNIDNNTFIFCTYYGRTATKSKQ